MDPPLNTEKHSSDYRKSHLGSVAAEYDDVLFRPGTYNHEVWQQEKALLDALVGRWVPSKLNYLDFACGTGRILSHMESRFEKSVGIDISADMLSEASRRTRAQLVCGDATANPELIQLKFDCVTAFRFFLNAEETLRDQAMAYLTTRLRSPESVLIFNVHGNKASTYGASVALKRLLGRQHNLMGLNEVKRLVHNHGLEIVEWCGINYLDQSLYTHLPMPVWRGMESALKRFRFLRRFSVYLYFVCRKTS